MPKVATQTSTKAATKSANAKTAKPAKEKTKRPPSAYNVFMKDRLTAFKAKHPEMSHKEAFTAVAALWKDAPENPNRGSVSASKKKSASEDKENASSKPKSKPKSKPSKKAVEKVIEQSEEEDEGQLGSDE